METNLADKVWHLLSVGSWWWTFNIIDSAYDELTLKVFTKFEKAPAQVTWNRADEIKFQIHGRSYRISYGKFALQMGLYDEEYTRTLKYENLHFHRPWGDPSMHCWHYLRTDYLDIDPRRSKVSTLKSSILRVLHTLISGTVTGRGYST